ncbi:MAG: hypothetical protein NZ949_06545, partial [Candidatus Kapabacteria bacterium]|nr:hypothetical protein [Candidatus Kapabacteria bacterium]MDW7997269.1 hypothetical protein [Bacteroidota bacterium]
AQIAEHLDGRIPLLPERLQAIEERIQQLQQRVGYTGDYRSWIQRHLPKRLEEMLQLEVSDAEE